MLPGVVGTVTGKQKKIPLMINQITEKIFTVYPITSPKSKCRRGSLLRPQVASIPCGTVYVIFSMRIAVLTIELNAAVDAM